MLTTAYPNYKLSEAPSLDCFTSATSQNVTYSGNYRPSVTLTKNSLSYRVATKLLPPFPNLVLATMIHPHNLPNHNVDHEARVRIAHDDTSILDSIIISRMSSSSVRNFKIYCKINCSFSKNYGKIYDNLFGGKIFYFIRKMAGNQSANR
jgi:hypothetical protein